MTALRLAPTRRVGECILATCEDCEQVIWQITDPYFRFGQVRFMHLRGRPGHRIVMYRIDNARGA